jgi:hypothetical protein
MGAPAAIDEAGKAMDGAAAIAESPFLSWYWRWGTQRVYGINGIIMRIVKASNGARFGALLALLDSGFVPVDQSGRHIRE